ncbi:MAG: chromosome segregation protein SMC [Gammaproteobacteria bacterium]
MRLDSIKLVGFKSFVDATNVQLRSNLTAIVGPNGCGKSNIVDAIRWVIGESSAKQLRGELLTDVIFSGTNQRKPVSQAAIELMFDNTVGETLGGAYAQYSQIAIRREIDREGHSQFYLNGTRCRRRDITDVFLGTGLGPNSYAIIEQGIISQLIEGKPEDIRSYLEEAAGISRYRERRRETENRMRSTRENLERLNDIRLEMEKQLNHLKRQANAAEKYKNLKQVEQALQNQLHTLHCERLVQQRQAQQQQLSEQSTQLELVVAAQTQLDQTIQAQRAQQADTQTHLNQIQETYYQTEAEIAKTLQSIQHIDSREQQLQADLQRVQRSLQEIEQQSREDQVKLAQLTTELTTLEPTVLSAQTAATTARAHYQAAEQDDQVWQKQWEQFQTQAAALEKQAHVEKNQLQHLQQRISQLTQKIQQLNTQLAQCQDDVSLLPAEMTPLQQSTADLKQQMENVQLLLQASNQQLQDQRTTNAALQHEKDQAQQALQQLLRQQSSLEALQQAALNKGNASVTDWLKQQHWQDKPRLLEKLTVASGWETAVETVLAPYLEAVCTEDAADITVAAQSGIEGRLAVFQAHDSAHHFADHHLASKVQSPAGMADLLGGIYVAETFEVALAQLSRLQPGESVVTREGIWLSQHWVRISKIQDESRGVLVRQQELQQIQKQIRQQQKDLQMAETAWQAGQTVLQEMEQQRDQWQRDYRELSQQYTQQQTQLSTQQARLEHLSQRMQSLTLDIQEQEQQRQEAQQQLDQLQHSQQHTAQQLTELTEQRLQLSQRREAQKAQLQTLRQQVEATKQQVDGHQLQLTRAQTQCEALQQHRDRSAKQTEQFQEHRGLLEQQVLEITQPLSALQATLNTLKEQNQTTQQRLTQCQQESRGLEQALREQEKQRSEFEQNALALRDALEKIRITLSAIEVEYSHHAELIKPADECSPTPENILEITTVDDCQQQLAQTQHSIQRLGAINLAAIEEYSEVFERKSYLDSQDQDLTAALATLEDAIRKIDKESRQRLQETFDRANANFKELFTRMFGGGQAALELSGEEVLQAGVMIRAQPPGKRNTLLHLLSGGEKALTAIALVFALFQLNPAPFCVLDEVDAPLDEANVGRFCRLVQAMSEKVQFIFISHNKVAMEMAKQLVGVTMHEPGVSRLVTVDIDQALALAEGEPA